jgi:hypothetical protein
MLAIASFARYIICKIVFVIANIFTMPFPAVNKPFLNHLQLFSVA